MKVKRIYKLAKMVIGQVTRKNDFWKAVRVQVPELERDKFLKLYYDRHSFYWAADPSNKCEVGDIVRILAQEEPQSARVQHELREIVFKVGHIIDPITGKRCRGLDFVNEELRKFGQSEVKQVDSQPKNDVPS